MARNKEELGEIEPLTVRFPKDILQVLRESAKANDRSLNAEIVNTVRSRVKEYQAQKEEYAHTGSHTS
jgi:predicted HicB family RNase H-like nuclease